MTRVDPDGRRSGCNRHRGPSPGCGRPFRGHGGYPSDEPNADVAPERYTADSPADDAPGDARVCVVAARPDTFDRCREGVYPAPRSYDRTREPFGFMAFYRTAPVSAVTHYAPVRDRTDQRRDEDGPLSPADWAATVEPFSETTVATVFELGDLVPLEAPVRNDLNGVRGAWYCTVDDLRAAGTLSDLADRSRT